LLEPLAPRENESVVVQCPTCSSKFRIGDDKVTDRGVRVRCTSCKNVFQVRKSGVVPADAPAAASEAPGVGVEAAPAAAPRSEPSPPRISRPPAPRTPVSNPPAPANGAPRRGDADDLFGMAELTGDAPARRMTPVGVKPLAKPAAKPMPNFDDIDLEVDDQRSPSARLAAAELRTSPGKPAPRNSDPPMSTRHADLPPIAPPLPPSISGEHVKLGAFKTALKDPFEGMDMGEPGTGAIELATQPKKDKLTDAAKAEARSRAAASEAAAISPEGEARPAAQEPEIPAGRAFVSSALTGLLGAALAIAVVIISALSDDAAAGWLGLGPSTDIVATKIVSGVYDTAAGKQVFYIRGRVENRSEKVRGPVRVTAELVADGAPEGRAETIAGAEPTAEDVWSLKSPADAEKLTRSLETSAVDRKVQPHGSLPFFAVIADPPQDLQNHRLRVRVEAVDAWVPGTAKGKGK
jgi:predicted Zn finger-like uncharacterized protein